MFKLILCLTFLFFNNAFSQALSTKEGVSSSTISPKLTTDNIFGTSVDYLNFISDQEKKGRLTVTHDKFKNCTEINTDRDLGLYELQFKAPDGKLPKGSGNYLILNVFAIVPDNTSIRSPATIGLVITSHTYDDWKYLRCQEFDWLVDDKHFGWLEEKYSGNTGNNNGAGIELYEQFLIILTPKQFEKLASSKKIDFKICNDEFVFNQKQYWVMSWVNEKIKELLKSKLKENQ